MKKFLITLSIATVVIVGACFSTVDPAPSAVLPYYNGGGFSSKLVIINPTQDGLKLPGFFGLSLVPGATYTEPFGESVEAGVKAIELSRGLVAYAEITNPYGAAIRVGPLEAVRSTRLFDLQRVGATSGVFIGALEDTVARVVGGAEAVVPAGRAVILGAPAEGVVIVEASLGLVEGKAPIYVFGYVGHNATGSLLAVEGR